MKTLISKIEREEIQRAQESIISIVLTINTIGFIALTTVLNIL